MVRAETEVYRIEVMDVESGKTLRTIERNLLPLPVTDAVWADATLKFRERNQTDGPLDCEIEEMRPEVLPVVRSVIADAQDRIWVEATNQHGVRLSGYDAAGRLLADFSIPRRDPDVPLYVRDDRLYIVTTDEYDVQSINVYQIAFLKEVDHPAPA